MCNVYGPAGSRTVTERFDAPFAGIEDYKPGLGPWSRGPFVRRRDGRREAVVGQWALIGDKDRQAGSRPHMTNNAPLGGARQQADLPRPWARGQRCLIPADWYQELNWESGKNVWWRFARADADCCALAGRQARRPLPSRGPSVRAEYDRA